MYHEDLCLGLYIGRSDYFFIDHVSLLIVFQVPLQLLGMQVLLSPSQ